MAGKSRYVLLLICVWAAASAFVPSIHEMPIPGSVAAQSGGAFRIQVDVELTTIEVTVHDKEGKPVRNLKKEDFQLYEDGKQQEIYSMDEVSAESRPASLGANIMDENALLRGKTVLILFDDSSIEPQYIKTARDSAEKFVRKYMRPQDVFAVADYGMSFKILQNFTHDPADVLKAIAQPAASNAGSGSIYFENLLRALDKINPSLARIKGQKTILIYAQPANLQSVEFRPSGFRMDPRMPMPGPLDSRLQVSSTLNSTYKNTLEAIRKSDAVVYTIDPGTLASADSGIALSLRSLAAESGGGAIRDTNNLEKELGSLDQQLSNYYVLGFQSDNPGHDGGFRKIEVRTELKGITLKHREGIPERRPIDALASEKQEKNLLTTIESPDAATQLPILFRPMYFYNSPNSARVLVAARIRMDKTVFKKKGAQLGTDLNIMGIAYGEDGSIAARFGETVPVRFDREKEVSYHQRYMGYRNYFILRPGRYRIKLAVSDETNNVGSTEQVFEVPVFPEGKMFGSSIVAAEQASRLPDLIQNLQAQLVDAGDPLVYSGMQIEPSVTNRYSIAAAIPVIFRLYGLPGTSDQWNLIAKVKLVDEKGKELSFNPIPLKKAVSFKERDPVAIGLRLSLPKTAPGKYKLIIEAGETASGQSTVLRTDVEFVTGSPIQKR